MIQLRLSHRNPETIEQIGEMLLMEQYVLEVTIIRGIECWNLVNNEVVKEKTNLLYAKTKALLFPHIERLIHKKHAGDMPILYSIPIVHMEWDQSEQLITDVKKI